MMAMNMSTSTLDGVFQALSDPTRRSILMRTRGAGESVSAIAASYEMSMPAVTKHLNILERAGLIIRSQQGRKRICRASPEALSQAMEWMTFYQSFWDANLNSLKQFLENE